MGERHVGFETLGRESRLKRRECCETREEKKWEERPFKKNEIARDS